MSQLFSVLFVCLGNICRSPMAEAAFIQEVKQRKLPIHVDSAGLGHWHINDAPDPRTITEVAKHGIDIRHYLGRQISKSDFEHFTHIIGMDHQNIIQLKQLAPEHLNEKITLFMDYVPEHHNQDVADPYYGDSKDFSKTWKQIFLGCHHLANYFEKQL